MGKGLGVAVLVAGVVALGLWARSDQGHRMENAVREAAASAVAGSVHGVQTAVAGRDIRVSGIADRAAEHDALLAALDMVYGRRVVVDKMTVLAPAAPFTLDVVKSDTGLVATGHVPTEALRSQLAAMLGAQADGLTLASGAPQGWADTAKAGIAALGPLIKGEMSLSDGSLRITGEALSPIELAKMQSLLNGLPEGAATTDIALLDDGTPADYTLDYAAGSGGRLTGKLPVGVTAAGVAKALGLGALAQDTKAAVIGGQGDLGLFDAIKGWMGSIETLSIHRAPGQTTVRAGLANGSDLESIRTALTADLGADVELELTLAPVSGADGDERTHALTGATERLAGGFWLPVATFDVGMAACQAEADTVLKAVQINFLSGSDQLDGSALQVLNRLASVIAPCAGSGLKAEIGGHTDASGDAVVNLGLSQKRAIAVRKALIVRGVPGAMLKAQGYGAAQPIADNATEEGRALNRRTTIFWSK